MNESDPMLAAMMRNGAPGLAGYAASELLESQPQLNQASAISGFAGWHAVLRNCVEELAASLAAGRPELFAGYLAWMQSVLAARGLPAGAWPSAVDCLAQVLESELPPGLGVRAAGLCHDALRELPDSLPQTASFLSSHTPQGRLAASYLLALLEGDRARASRLIFTALDGGLSLPELYLQVLLPAQQEVGRMWEADEILVAEEHFATSTTKMIFAQLRLRFTVRQRKDLTLVAAAVKGNQHDIGLEVVADFFDMDGWKVIHLGADMPVADLVQSVECYKPHLLALSVSLHTQLGTLAETVKAVRQIPQGAVTKILAGGLAFAATPDLAQQLGADGYAPDPQTGVALGNQLVTGLYGP